MDYCQQKKQLKLRMQSEGLRERNDHIASRLSLARQRADHENEERRKTLDKIKN